MKIDLHIEELVLHGFRRADRRRIAAAVQRELTRLLRERGVPPRLQTGGEVARVDGNSFDMTAGTPPSAVGARVARSVYGSLGQ